MRLLNSPVIFGVDAMPLVSALRKQGIPVLKLECEYRLGGEGQLRTRVQAFIESRQIMILNGGIVRKTYLPLSMP